MHELLGQILHAHGGIDRWNQYEKVEATIVSGGGFFPLKGVIQDADPRRMAVWLHHANLELRRHDYCVNIAGGFKAAQLTSDYAIANGIRFPTKRRAYTRGPDRRPITDMLMVTIDISNVGFT